MVAVGKARGGWSRSGGGCCGERGCGCRGERGCRSWACRSGRCASGGGGTGRRGSTGAGWCACRCVCRTRATQSAGTASERCAIGAPHGGATIWTLLIDANALQASRRAARRTRARATARPLAAVADTVGVGVFLSRVMRVNAIVAAIPYAVTIGVLLSKVMKRRAVVARVANTVTVGVGCQPTIARRRQRRNVARRGGGDLGRHERKPDSGSPRLAWQQA